MRPSGIASSGPLTMEISSGFMDGTLVLDGPGQAIDGRWSLELDRFHLSRTTIGKTPGVLPALSPYGIVR